MSRENKERFVFFGTPYIARDTLAILHEHGFIPEVVITNPDAPRGRGHVMTPSETKVYAEEIGIEVLTPDRLDDDFIENIAKYECDYAVVVAYGKILPEKLIESFPKGVLNVHYSLLPQYRGASPVEKDLLNGEKRTGVAIQKMVYELDAGDIVAKEETDVLPDDTTHSLREKLIPMGAKLLVSTLPHFLSGSIVLTPQDNGAATYAPKIKKADGEISIDDPDMVNWNKYRAYSEWPGVFFFKNGKRIKITEAQLDPAGHFKILRVVPEGKKETAYETFLNALQS